MKTALKCGCILGVANTAWLYLAYYLGLHTNGILVFQGFMVGWFVLNLAGFIFALQAVRRDNPDITYLRGLGAGALVAAVSAVFAVLMQIGYYKVIHPEWATFMVEETRKFFTAQGLTEAHVNEMVKQARQTFALGNYAMQSAFTAMFTGLVMSAVILIFLCRKGGAAPRPLSTDRRSQTDEPQDH